MNKPTNFRELLELQRVLDIETAKPRENGFTPRSREELDILLSVDDEIQEWCRELPSELNFKTWKQKEYNRKKELEARKIQYKMNGTWVLSARYSEAGYTSIKQNELENGTIIYDRKWTGLGRDFLIDLFNN